jgi:site-specific DNA recombinase
MGIIAIYIRVSSQKQVDKDNDKNGGSLTTQWETCVNLMKGLGYKEEDLIKFNDEGISGKTVIKRNGLRSLLTRIKKQNSNDPEYIEAICSYNLSRLSRSIKDSAEIHQLLKGNKIKLYLADGSCKGELEGATAKMNLTILSLMNEMYLDTLKEAVIPGMEQSAKEGNFQGGIAPFGYNYNLIFNEEKQTYSNMLIINDEEAKVVNRMFGMFVNGESLYGICKTLNSLGITTKDGKQFKTITVKYILKNPIYIGKIVWGKQKIKDIDENGNKELIKTDVYDMDIENAKGKHQAIINEDLYYKVMQRMKAIERPKKNKPTSEKRKKVKLEDFYSANRRMFSNTLCCPQCGSRMTTSPSYYTRKDGTNVEAYYYKCNAFNSGQNQCDGYYSVKETQVYELIREDFFEKLEFVYGLIHYYKSINKNNITLIEEVKSEKYCDLIRLEERKKSLEKDFKNVREQIIKFNKKDEFISKEFEKDLEEISDTLKSIDKEIEIVNIDIEKEKTQRILLMKEFNEQEKYNDIQAYFLSLPQMQQRGLIEQVYNKIIIRTEGRKRTHKTFEVKEKKYNPDFSLRKIVSVIGIDFNDFYKKLKDDGFEFSSIIKHFETAKEFEDLISSKNQSNRVSTKLNSFIDDLYKEYYTREHDKEGTNRMLNLLLTDEQKNELKVEKEKVDDIIKKGFNYLQQSKDTYLEN